MIEALQIIPSCEVYFTTSDAPWFTPIIKCLINKRWEAFRSRNWSLYNSLKVKVKKEIFKAKMRYFQKKSSSVKGLWSHVRIERGAHNKRSPLDLVEEGSALIDLLNKLNDQYCSVMNPSPATSSPAVIHDDSWMPSFGVEDVWRALKHLPPKATGSDDIPTLLYKKCALILAEPIHHLICESLRQRKFPSIWKVADVIAAPKSSGSSIEDTRPISLLPIPSKVAEKIILADMKSCLTRLLGNNQFGIRRKSSTTHAIVAIHDALTKLADDPDIGATIFIGFDFSKAFDKICHEDLIRLTQQLNLPTGFSIFLDSYLRNRQQRVRANGFKGASRKTTSGVPQGCILGPYLFGIYVASLQPLYPTTTMIKFVDDLSIVLGIRKANINEDIGKLMLEVESISRWSTLNNMQLNESKTTGLVKYHGSFQDRCDLKLLLPNIAFHQSVRFLGVFIDENLRWRSHVRYALKKCSQRMFVLRRLKAFTTNEEFISIYNALIRSLLEYASPAFIGLSNQESKLLEKVQNRCLKIKGNLRLPDLATRRRLAAVKFFTSVPLQTQ